VADRLACFRFTTAGEDELAMELEAFLVEPTLDRLLVAEAVEALDLGGRDSSSSVGLEFAPESLAESRPDFSTIFLRFLTAIKSLT
jgi:hypothetical protein